MAVSPEEEARLLSEVDVLEPLSQDELDELARELPDTRLGEGEFLYTRGTRGEDLFVLKKGRVRVYRTDPEGGEFTLEVVGEGTIFGEMALGPRRLRAAHAQAVEPSLVGRLRREHLEDLIRRNPEVGIRLVRLLSQRLRLSHNRMADFADKDVTARLASLIVYLAESEGVATGEGNYRIPTRYTHERLGTMIDKRVVGAMSGMCALCYAALNRERKRRWRKHTGTTPAVVPNLRAVRRALGVGFKEFARLADISETHLANIETGKRRASRKMQRRLVAAVASLRVKHPERWEQLKEGAC